MKLACSDVLVAMLFTCLVQRESRLEHGQNVYANNSMRCMRKAVSQPIVVVGEYLLIREPKKCTLYLKFFTVVRKKTKTESSASVKVSSASFMSSIREFYLYK